VNEAFNFLWQGDRLADHWIHQYGWCNCNCSYCNL